MPSKTLFKKQPESNDFDRAVAIFKSTIKEGVTLNNTLVDDISTLESRFKQAKEQGDAIVKQNATAVTELDKVRKEQKEIEKDLYGKKVKVLEELSKREEEVVAGEATLKEDRALVDSRKENIERLIEDNQKISTTLEAKDKELEARVGVIQAHDAELNNKTKKAEAILDDAEQAKIDIKTSMDALDVQARKMELEKSKLGQDMVGAQQLISDLNMKQAQLDARASKLERKEQLIQDEQAALATRKKALDDREVHLNDVIATRK